MDGSKTNGQVKDRHRWADRRDTDRQTDGQITEEKRKTEMDRLERDRQRWSTETETDRQTDRQKGDIDTETDRQRSQI